MSTKKQGGKLVQHKRPQPKYLGLKVSDGEKVGVGSILIRQRGTETKAGDGVKKGRDHTLYSVRDGHVKFSKKIGRKYVSIIT